MSTCTTRSLLLCDPSQPARPRHMAYYEWGDPQNPEVAICLHGLSRNGRDFDAVAQSLCATYRVLCPDMAGRGKSAWLHNKADYSYATYLADIDALYTQLGLKSVSWIGTSMGGILGMMIAAGQPGRIARLVLNDVGATVSARGLKRILEYVGSSSPFADRETAMRHLRAIMAPFGIRDASHWEFMFSISFVALPDGTFTFAYDPAIAQPFKDGAAKGAEVADIDLSMFWNEVKCPALILRGADSDILTRSTAQAMCNRTAATSYVEFEGAGHAPALMDAHQLDTLTQWMQQSRSLQKAS